MFIALSFAIACAPASGELQVVVDSSMASYIVEVLALRASPGADDRVSTVARGAPSSPAATTTLDDSARRLDAAFQAARERLNREAIALRGRDRRTLEYVSAYADLDRRIAAAERLRTERDALRAKSGPRSAVDRSSPPDTSRVDEVSLAGRERDAIRGVLENGAVTLRLARGIWWIAAADSAGALVGRAVRHEVRAGERDTLRLGGSR